MAANESNLRARALAVIRVLYVVLLVVVLVVAVVQQRETLADLITGARPAWLAAALALTFGQLWLSSVWWSSALHGLGSPAPATAVLSATVRSLPARYLPGSIWYPLGRAALLASGGVRKSALATLAVLEAAMSVVVAFCMGGLALTFAGFTPQGTGWVAVLCIALLGAVSPPVVNRAWRWVATRRQMDPPSLGWAAYARLLAWMAAFWALSAFAFTVYLQAFPDVLVRNLLTVAGAFLVAWGIGFLAVFAPQGLGVFEVALAALLVGGPETGVAGVAVVIAGFRALVAVRDAFAFAVGSLERLRQGTS